MIRFTFCIKDQRTVIAVLLLECYFERATNTKIDGKSFDLRFPGMEMEEILTW